MKKAEYLESAAVKSFIAWVAERLDQPGSFARSYTMKRPYRVWMCNSIYNAFENYCWPFSYKDPFSAERITGMSFDDSLVSLEKLSKGLKQCVAGKNNDGCRDHCFSILDWGGVLPNNRMKIIELNDDICNYLTDVKGIFSKDIPYYDYYDKKLIMNSGFTKIYSLFIDDFIIFDGRVGAALGLLIRNFCEDAFLDTVPKELSFAWGRGKESRRMRKDKNKRNPSSVKYVFPELSNNPARHTENNVRANWLLREIIQQTGSGFQDLQPDVQMRALEAALFMIGYDVLD